MITVDKQGNIVNKDEFELDEAISGDSRNNIITAITAGGQTIQVFNGVVSLGGEVFPKVDNTPDEPVQELANSLPEGASSCTLPDSLPGVYTSSCSSGCPAGNMIIIDATGSGTFSVTEAQPLADQTLAVPWFGKFETVMNDKLRVI